MPTIGAIRPPQGRHEACPYGALGPNRPTGRANGPRQGDGKPSPYDSDGERRGRRYATKQVEAFAVEENGWFVITVIVKYF